MKIMSPRKRAQMMMEQYWLGIDKPKMPSISHHNFKKKTNCFTEFPTE